MLALGSAESLNDQRAVGLWENDWQQQRGSFCHLWWKNDRPPCNEAFLVEGFANFSDTRWQNDPPGQEWPRCMWRLGWRRTAGSTRSRAEWSSGTSKAPDGDSLEDIDVPGSPPQLLRDQI